MAIAKVILNGETQIDVTQKTVTAETLLSGVTALKNDGTSITGVLSNPAIGIEDTPDSAGGTVRTITAVSLAGDTVTAEHLESGYTAHDATGQAITGSLVIPTGGLEYETGTFTLTEDVNQPTITFANSHSSAPMFAMIADVTGTAQTTNYSAVGFVYGNWYRIFGAYTNAGDTNSNYSARVSYVSRAMNNSVSGTNANETNDYSNVVSSSNMTPSTVNVYFRAGRTYKWIAVWAPTT